MGRRGVAQGKYRENLTGAPCCVAARVTADAGCRAHPRPRRLGPPAPAWQDTGAIPRTSPFRLPPGLVVPALLGLDAAMPAGRGRPVLLRAGVLLDLALAGLALCGPTLRRAEDAWLQRRLPPPVPQPDLAIAAATPPPEVPWIRAIMALGDDVVARLPAGARIAASEVGYLGAVNPAVTLIDIAGLNDTRIAGRASDGRPADPGARPDLGCRTTTIPGCGGRSSAMRGCTATTCCWTAPSVTGWRFAATGRTGRRSRPGCGRPGTALYPGRVMADYVVRGRWLAGAGPAGRRRRRGAGPKSP